jgi:parallel beta-helix repeat protein
MERSRRRRWSCVRAFSIALASAVTLIALASEPYADVLGLAGLHLDTVMLARSAGASPQAWLHSAEVGPSATITCPPRAVSIEPGRSIQSVVDRNPPSTKLCIRAGVHYLTGSITPKSGDVFVGEYGAILDGINWTTRDDTQGAFRAHNQDIDDVIIRNLVIRRMPQRGVHAYPSGSERWTIDHNEIAENLVGVVVPGASIVDSNFIHHNIGDPKSTVYAEQGGGYQLYRANNVRFERNEISFNSINQKVVESTNVVFRANFVHDNLGNGIWYDGDNVGSLIEENQVDDNAGEGIFYEVSGRGVIRGNVVRRSGTSGIFVSTSRDTEVDHNTLEDNFRGINLFLNCDAAGMTTVITYALANNRVHDNVITVGQRSGSLASSFSYSSTCTPAQLQPYFTNPAPMAFARNTYHVPSTTGRYWMWGDSKSWAQWQELGHDRDGGLR